MGTVPGEHLTPIWKHMLAFTYGERRIKAALPLYYSPDETVTSSVKLLVDLFGQVRNV